MQQLNRRTMLAGLAALAVSPAAAWAAKPSKGAKSGGRAARTSARPCQGPVNVFIPFDYQPLAGQSPESLAPRLARATLDFVQAAYAGQNLPLWRKPATEIDLQRRLDAIALAVLRAVAAQRETYPVDPAWLMGQIMAESFFNEFAVSRSLAVGVAQFIPETGRGYGMLVAGDRPEHSAAPYARPELSGKMKEFYDLRGQLRDLRAAHKRFEDEETVNRLLEAALSGQTAAAGLPEAEAFLAYRREEKRLDTLQRQALDDAREYLRANFEGRDIFNPQDLEFLRGFDARTDPAAAIPAMVKYMAGQLRNLSGNIIAATAAYNAGPGRVTDDGCYAPFGRIPGNTETPTYVSRILVHHHEISSRLA